MKTNLAIVIPASIIILSFTISEAWAFRCGTGLVTTGDTKAQVLNTCGKPSSKEIRCKESWTAKKQKCDKKVEVWYYNCGDTDFIYALTFENNTLKGENPEGRGSGRSDCIGK